MAKKRPCKICGQWFYPNPRLGNRQKTCGSAECKREWHKRKCGEWNSKNRDYFRGIYLKKRSCPRLLQDKQDQIVLARCEAVRDASFLG